MLLQLLLALVSQANLQELPPIPLYTVQRAAQPIVIDGVLGEFSWTVAQRLRLIKFRREPEDGKALQEQTHIAALWDDDNLYLAFSIADREMWATLKERDARLFPEECIEFFVDPDGDVRRYIETQINTVGNVRDLLATYSNPRPTLAQFDEMAKWNYARLQKAITLQRDRTGKDVGWILEIAIPWSEFSFGRRTWPPRDGEDLRINFYRYERRRNGDQLEQSGWSRVSSSFHDPARFGRFIFSLETAGAK